MEVVNVEDDDVMENYGDGGLWIRGRLLGEGSFGAVFLATPKGSCSRFLQCPSVMAVKSAEIACAESLRHERRVLSRLVDCSSVVQCFGAEITRKSDGSGVYNLLLEYGSGGTLEDKIERSRSRGLPESEVRWYTRSIVEGLIKIHEAGFVHCDLKPDNILLFSTDQKGQKFNFRAKICDFGLSKGVKEDRQKRKLDRTWKGTPWYLAPEAVKEGLQETPADIWSLGIIVLEMLTGLPAWDLEEGSGTDAEKIIRKIQKAACLPKIPRDLSPMAKSFLHSCLRRMVKNRATAKWLLRHPFISGFQDDNRRAASGAESTVDSARYCIPSRFNPELIPRLRIHFA